MTLLLLKHWGVLAFAAYWLFSAFVSGMPEPTPVSSLAYHWLFTSLNTLAANLYDVFQALRLRFPWLPLPRLRPGAKSQPQSTPQE